MKIGNYVRTEYGIAKIVPDGRFTINDNGNKTIYVDTNGIHSQVEFADYVWSNDIIKSSPNIIDLIEEGDYVNGHYVEGVEKVPNEEVYKVIRTSTCDGMDGETLNIYKEEIESIVTKEQFKEMEYKIGD